MKKEYKLLLTNQKMSNNMGQMKELFISMQEGLMQGVAITNAQRERDLQEEEQGESGKVGIINTPKDNNDGEDK